MSKTITIAEQTAPTTATAATTYTARVQLSQRTAPDGYYYRRQRGVWRLARLPKRGGYADQG